jgi:1A family penicillin-binding protein
MSNVISLIRALPTKLKTFKEELPQKIERLKHINKDDIKAFLIRSKRPIMFAIMTGTVVMLLIPIITYVYFVRDLATKDRIINKKNAGVILLDREEKPFFTLFEARTKNAVPLSSIPKHTRHAFIAVEDKDFYEHPGFSIKGIGRAIQTNLAEEEFAAGGSTISQQLMKNTILSQNKNLLRKYQELVLAIELERRYSKDDILEMYLNTVYFGEGAFGIEDAAKRYFSKSASQLTLGESALLAGIIRAPSALSPLSGDEPRALKRQQLILSLMQDQGYINASEEEQAVAQKIVYNPTEQDINDQAVHFALMVQKKLVEEYGEQEVAQSGFVVKTTLDVSLQEIAQQTVASQVQRLARNNATNAAAVAIDPKTGEVLALVGSHDWNDENNGKINMALEPRQPGSAFKPIIYAKALEDRRITGGTILEDKEVSFGSYKPRNYDNKFRGKVIARYALANSLNIPALHVMDMVGVRDGVEAAQELGITTLKDDVDYGLPLVLGAAEVPLIEMTNAYAVFANEGIKNEYVLYTEIKNKNGDTIFAHSEDPQRVIPESVAYIISSILSDRKARSDTFGGSLNLSRDAAVKTGTTNDYKDALTIGYTPQVVVGAWVGNNDSTPMDSVAGSSGAAPIWRQIMEGYLRGKVVDNFDRPSNILKQLICLENGLKAEIATTSAYDEFFLRGTVPTKDCGLVTPTPTPEEKKDEENSDPTPSPTPTQASESQPTPTTSATTPTQSQDITPTTVITPTDGILPTIITQ